VIDDATPAPRGSFVQVATTPLAVMRVHEAGGEVRLLHLDALTRQHYRPWVWAVMPFAVALDAVTTPPLLLLAPIVMVVGD
jgi:hypothetical protein